MGWKRCGFPDPHRRLGKRLSSRPEQLPAPQYRRNSTTKSHRCRGTFRHDQSPQPIRFARHTHHSSPLGSHTDLPEAGSSLPARGIRQRPGIGATFPHVSALLAAVVALSVVTLHAPAAKATRERWLHRLQHDRQFDRRLSVGRWDSILVNPRVQDRRRNSRPLVRYSERLVDGIRPASCRLRRTHHAPLHGLRRQERDRSLELDYDDGARDRPGEGPGRNDRCRRST